MSFPWESIGGRFVFMSVGIKPFSFFRNTKFANY